MSPAVFDISSMLTMTTPSYAAAAQPPIRRENGSMQNLYTPPPTSMTLVAALLLLDNPLFTKTKFDRVYLLPRPYVQNWILWAYHQSVPNDETRRLQLALRMASEYFRLTMPKLGDDFHDPGPIDCSTLAEETRPLVLKENVEVWDGKENEKTGEEEKSDLVYCCAVPERFFELLRSVHGVLCEDLKSITFQGAASSSLLIQYFEASKPKNVHSRPIQFQRHVMFEKRSQKERKEKLLDASLSHHMNKLMIDEDCEETLVPVVEVYPRKFLYSLVTPPADTKKEKVHGFNSENTFQITKTNSFFLASKLSDVDAVLNAILKEVAPNKSSSCVRLWCKHVSGTRSGDGYELVELDQLTIVNGKVAIKGGSVSNGKDTKEQRSVEDWMKQHEPNLLVETRNNSSSKWLRESLILSNRIDVGDFVDAQDTAGNWYEAVVREVGMNHVLVHYLGWASRWDGKIRRRNDDEELPNGISKKCLAPAPLWAHTKPWRQNIEVGQNLEIRDSRSTTVQPKWFRAIVLEIGKPDDKPRPLEGSARLEELESTDGQKYPILLLKRKQQIKVEVPQEKERNIALAMSKKKNKNETYDSKENAPYSRWVNLYGEELCIAGTHMKAPEIVKEKKPVTIMYEFDPRKPPVEVLKSPFHGAGFVRESLRGQPPAPGSVGLQNLGNSCYMNSIVQCLNHCEPVLQYFLHQEYAKDLNQKNPLGSSGKVALAYASLLDDIWGGQYSVLAPRLLKITIANFAPQFNNIYQHDSHEFNSFIMDGLHEDCNRVKSKPYVEDLEGFGMPDEKIAIESWRRHLLRHDSIIVDHFQGMHRSHVTCPICGRESIKFDVYSSISVPLPSSKSQAPVYLKECLEKFTEGEQLDENNAWYCPNCKRHVCALKMLAVWSLPDILIIHLKRFTYETKNGKVERSKIEDKVLFPIENLDLTEFLLGPVDPDALPIYDLFGVSEHQGGTANSGHYTATVRNSQDRKWYRYNDSHVGTSSGEASVTGGAYLLFYKRAKGSSRWAGMEKDMRERGVDPHGDLSSDLDGFTEVKTKKRHKKKAPNQ
mmetsp:Transcript_30782/g.45536  ORF Transcript_30782/g.45536 Transcript_30782/m.45536 type:complete len:1052 (+) Transcript_30782:47-3202(+)